MPVSAVPFIQIGSISQKHSAEATFTLHDRSQIESGAGPVRRSVKIGSRLHTHVNIQGEGPGLKMLLHAAKNIRLADANGALVQMLSIRTFDRARLRRLPRSGTAI